MPSTWNLIIERNVLRQSFILYKSLIIDQFANFRKVTDNVNTLYQLMTENRFQFLIPGF